ncbi:MAG: response regulator [Candidatus Parcubacteria bacterium]|nr:response regulator [Candidatus Parcubacteria bacterium]
MNDAHVMKSEKGRILFVEDEMNLVDMYHAYFEQKGYDFLSTADIEEALHVTEFEQPDVILLDLIIPKIENGVVHMDAEQGYVFLEKVKKNPKTKNIPILVFTSLDTIKDRERCKEMGAIDYIFKGKALPKEVLAAVEAVVKK